jgi:hypothetical protein
MVRMLFAEQPGANEIDREPNDRDGNRLGVGYGHRLRQSHQALIGDQQRDHAERDGAREGGKVAELPGAKGEARIMFVMARVLIGESGNGKRRSVRRHMPAIGEERHRAEHDAADDFGDHHGCGQPYDQPGAPFVAGMTGAEEDVLMGPRVERARMHRLSLCRHRAAEQPSFRARRRRHAAENDAVAHG